MHKPRDRKSNTGESTKKEWAQVIHITDEQLSYLRIKIVGLDEAVSTGDAEQLLDLIDDEIVNNILGNNDEPDETGIQLQRVFDQIYSQND